MNFIIERKKRSNYKKMMTTILVRYFTHRFKKNAMELTVNSTYYVSLLNKSMDSIYAKLCRQNAGQFEHIVVRSLQNHQKETQITDFPLSHYDDKTN